jgi:hypothetical protein
MCGIVLPGEKQHPATYRGSMRGIPHYVMSAPIAYGKQCSLISIKAHYTMRTLIRPKRTNRTYKFTVGVEVTYTSSQRHCRPEADWIITPVFRFITEPLVLLNHSGSARQVL